MINTGESDPLRYEATKAVAMKVLSARLYDLYHRHIISPYN